MQVIIFSLLVLILPLAVNGHSGGTDSSGCHVESSNGIRHCHDDESKMNSFFFATAGTAFEIKSHQLGVSFLKLGKPFIKYQYNWPLKEVHSIGLNLGILTKEFYSGGKLVKDSAYYGMAYKYQFYTYSFLKVRGYSDFIFGPKTFIGAIGIELGIDLLTVRDHLEEWKNSD